jgi:peptidoglycan hydrolase-like protein with peptidoglycan-binding domain
MKTFVSASLLACATVSFGLGLSTTSVHATSMNTNDSVRSAQMDLASLGYYVGRYDGIMGPTTEHALMDFQRVNGLAVTGYLNAETFDMLQHYDYAVYHPGYNSYHTVYAEPIVMNTPAYWDDRWHYVRTQTVPIRYGHLDIDEDNRGSVRHYAVTLNGQPVLFANNQPGILRVSQTYQIDGQDAIVFTAYHGDGVCAYKSYLLTVHSDGSFNNPKEIGNCNGSYEAHVADNALFVSFPGVNLMGMSTWDVWRYENDDLVRL